ncbi:uncharacterized protein LOC133791803 [Humulus lupulus]|uniref:uncharacterized protein LOC133791803 n=1 Tax=Humulus lupulus TaxID=3486 RepID=UPI002B40B6B5|nr:uncharacterized protein LOC133791803 [Humulus lupulus]
MTKIRASIRSLETQIGQLTTLMTYKAQVNLPSITEVNPKEQCQAIILRSGTQYEGPRKNQLDEKRQDQKIQSTIEKKPSKEKVTVGLLEKEVVSPVSNEHHIKIPYPQRLYKKNLDKQFAKFLEEFKKLHINIPSTEVLKQMPSYVKFMKYILSNKRKMGDYEATTLTKECSSILQRKLPQKLRDPGSFTIPFTVENFECKHALCDLDVSMNLMPLSVFCRLGLGEARPTTELAGRSVKYPRRIIEDVSVKVDKFIFPAYFIILDMEEDANVPIMLGRPFLAIEQALIDEQKRELRLRVKDRVVARQKLVEDPLELSLIVPDVDEEDGEEALGILSVYNSYEPLSGKRFEELGQGPERPLPSIEKLPALELKALPYDLRYAYLGEKETLPIIVSSYLFEVEVEELLRVLQVHKMAIGWTLTNINVISPSTRMHHILVEDDAKPTIDAQRRSNQQ